MTTVNNILLSTERKYRLNITYCLKLSPFLQIVGQAGIDRKTLLDHLHLIGYYRKTLEPRLSCKILFSNNISKMMDGWMEKTIQFDTNWRMENLFFNPDMKATSSKKADTSKSNGNARW
jgi:hypothetical protein